MTNLTRRAALAGALASSAALAVPAGKALEARAAPQATQPPENAKRPPATIPEHAAAIADLLRASGDTWMVSITADRIITDMHPGRPDASVRVVELMRALSSALEDWSQGAGNFRAIVEPDGKMWLQGTHQPRLKCRPGSDEYLLIVGREA